jgi:hypothetical protein
MSSAQRTFWTACFSLGALAIATASCSESRTERASAAFQISSGVTLSAATYWVIAPDGTVTTGAVSVGSSLIVPVIVSGLPTATGYQLIVSGVASDNITGCSGSATFNVPTPSTGVIVHLVCAGPPSPGQALVTANVNICPVIDGVSSSPSETTVGGSMALQIAAHDPDSGPAALTYAWSADGGTLGAGGGAAATFACTQAGTFNVSVAASDGDSACGAAETLTVICTEL